MHGIHTAVVTPFRSDGELDPSGLEHLIETQLAGGVHGIVICGTTGETPTLTQEEWETTVRAAVEIVHGRVPVTAGIGTNNTRTSVENARRARELGADAGLLVFPYYNKPNPSGHRAHVRAVGEAGLPLVLYHVPGRTGQRLSASLVAELAGFPGVIAVKEATGDLVFGGDVITATDTPILSGDDFTFLPLLSMGGAGCISVVSNVAPKTTVAVYDAFTKGDVSAARRLMHDLWPLVHYLFSDTNPVPCKAVLAAKGICGDTVRLPLAASDTTVSEDLVVLA
ncbi:MAG: 4-hydroxy-tetrahydrodipicolinate synthase [Alphaproteobacteria bacterium]|nr:4-hydroxy-tetrahydrodipicolinate synthase [Alphaproteobacteria bacterium]